MIFQGLLGERVPLAGRDFSLELLVPDLILVTVKPGPQFTQLVGRQGAQLFGNFLNSAHSGLLSDGTRLRCKRRDVVPVSPTALTLEQLNMLALVTDVKLNLDPAYVVVLVID